jgi:hypothetical protein
MDLFLLEKALYELRYEIANRPDWVAIPARGSSSWPAEPNDNEKTTMNKAMTQHGVELWNGAPHPLGRHLGRPGREFRALLAPCREGRAVPVRRDGRRETRIPLRERTDFVWHGYVRRSGPASSTATACTAPSSPRKATASTRTSCCSIRTRARSWGPLAWSDAHFGYTIGHKKEDLSLDKHDDASGCRSRR